MTGSIKRAVRSERKTTVTLEQKEYERILREAVGAPDNALVDVENNYGGDITITWTVTENREGE